MNNAESFNLVKAAIPLDLPIVHLCSLTDSGDKCASTRISAYKTLCLVIRRAKGLQKMDAEVVIGPIG